jgi:glyoxylase I family protein
MSTSALFWPIAGPGDRQHDCWRRSLTVLRTVPAQRSLQVKREGRMDKLSVRAHHVVVTVTNIDRSREWYRRLLGAEPLIDGPVEPLPGHHRGYYHVVFPLSDGIWFGLHRLEATRKDDSFSEFRPGLDHVAFAAEDRSEMEAWEQRLSELNIALEVWTALPSAP